MGIKLVESGETIPGALDSHETETGLGTRPHPLLLSQAVQARLGLTKSARYGKVTLDDYNGQSLEVAREQGTGLFMVRIDHLSPEQYQHLPIRDLLIEQPSMPCPLAIDSSDEEADNEEQEDLGEEAVHDDDEWPTQQEFESWLKAAKQPAEATAESHCYVSRRHKPQYPRRNFPAIVLEAQTVIVTCGMNNFEFSS